MPMQIRYVPQFVSAGTFVIFTAPDLAHYGIIETQHPLSYTPLSGLLIDHIARGIDQGQVFNLDPAELAHRGTGKCRIKERQEKENGWKKLTVHC